MCLIPQAFLKGIADFEHTFRHHLGKAILKDEGMELLLILRYFSVFWTKGVDLTDEACTVLEDFVDYLQHVDAGVFLHQFFRDGVAHLIEEEEAVPDLQGSGSST